MTCGLTNRFHILRYDVIFADHGLLLGLTLLGAKSASLASQIVRLLSTLRVLARTLLHAHVAIERVVVTP